MDAEELLAQEAVIDIALDSGQDLRQERFKRDNSGDGHEASLYASLRLPTQIAKKMQTTYPLKVQAIRSQGQQPRLYVSFPLPLAAAIGLEAGEMVQWNMLDRIELHFLRPQAAPSIPPLRALKNSSSATIITRPFS